MVKYISVHRSDANRICEPGELLSLGCGCDARHRRDRDDGHVPLLPGGDLDYRSDLRKFQVSPAGRSFLVPVGYNG